MHFSDVLINWYSKNKRDLPWRKITSPYHVWLSEIILQQTRVAQGMSYYRKFVEHYPTIIDLAHANEDEVLKLWQGLGYYSRARNLYATAKIVAFDLNGEFPTSYNEMIKLKGIGAYTAAAISSFCFEEPKAVVDGNVYRVLSRYFGVKTPIDSSKGKKEFQELADECLNQNMPGTHNQAIMEFGALQCLPKPSCSDCPLETTCEARLNNLIDDLPIKEKKIKVRNRHFNYIVLTNKDQCLIEKRISKDIWQNLFQFPLVESENEVLFVDALNFNSATNLLFTGVSEQYKHVLSHQRIYAKFWRFDCENLSSFKQWKVIDKSEIQNYAIPRLIDKYLKSVKF